jgi:hypothetical protein
MTPQLDSRATQATPATFAGMFFIALGTLTYELLLTRIFSVTMLSSSSSPFPWRCSG